MLTNSIYPHKRESWALSSTYEFAITVKYIPRRQFDEDEVTQSQGLPIYIDRGWLEDSRHVAIDDLRIEAFCDKLRASETEECMSSQGKRKAHERN